MHFVFIDRLTHLIPGRSATAEVVLSAPFAGGEVAPWARETFARLGGPAALEQST